jgi:eukaryotic-like serine/threonine-protein kinase
MIKMKRLTTIRVLLLVSMAFITIQVHAVFKNSTGHSNCPPEQVVPLKTVWKFNLGKNKAIPQLVFSEGMIYWGDDEGIFYALDSKNGKIKWQFKTSGPIYEKPAISNGMAYFCSYEGVLHAINLAKGTEKWKYPTGPEFRCTPSVIENHVVVNYKKQMICLDIETGLELWKNNCIAINYLQYLLKDSTIYFTDNSQIIAINANNCKDLWHYDQQVFGMSHLQAGFGCLYLTSPEGVFCIRISDGKPKWKFGFDKTIVPKYYTNLYLVDSAVYAPVDFTLYVFNASNGKILWGIKSKIKKDINNVSVSGNNTYYTESTDIIYLISRSNLKKIEAFKVETVVNSQLHVENNMGYFVSADGFIYGVKFP